MGEDRMDFRKLKNFKTDNHSYPKCSVLTCKSNGSIVKNVMVGIWLQEKLISLGGCLELLQQSIGEPGTQLTMSNLTGGIFTSELLKQITAPFQENNCSKIFKTISYRTNHGTVVLKL
jgi:hypothetical protein